MAQGIDQSRERLIAELEALRETQERWRSILENLPGVIVAAEPDGTVAFVNRTLSGIPPEQVIGTSVLDHVLPEHRPTLQDALDRALSAGETVTYEVVASPLGVPIPLESRVGPLERDGRIVGVTIVSTDISERKRAEEERRQLEVGMQNAQRLESLGILAGGIAHDFNNLLVVILGNADLALMDVEPHAPYRESIEQIKLAAKRASELSNQMLIYSGGGMHAAELLDLNGLVVGMGKLLRVSVSKKVVLNWECDDDVPLINADASQMRQVVMNLIMNASEAIGDRHGSVTIRIGAVQLGQEIASRTLIGEDLTHGRYVRFEVADTGPGIEAVGQVQALRSLLHHEVCGAWIGTRCGARDRPCPPGSDRGAKPGRRGLDLPDPPACGGSQLRSAPRGSRRPGSRLARRWEDPRRRR